MNPLVLLAGNLVPALIDIIAGDKAGKVSRTVADAVTGAVGTADPVEAQTKLAQDPALAAQLRIALAQIATDEKRLLIEAEAQARKDALDAEIALHKAKLDAANATREAELRQREIDLRETQGARQMMIDIKDGYVRRTPMVLSYIVTAGFFLVLILFVVMKNSIESTRVAPISDEIRALLPTMRPDQIAALVMPRSDFVIQIINICVGALAAAFATVMSFWLGSSQSSRNKDAIVANMQERTAETQERQTQANFEMTRKAVEATRGGKGGGGGQQAPGGATDETGEAPETKQDPASRPDPSPAQAMAQASSRIRHAKIRSAKILSARIRCGTSRPAPSRPMRWARRCRG